MIRRTLLAAALAVALASGGLAQGLRQVGNDDYGMIIEEVHPTGGGIRVRVLIENLTTESKVFLHHEANQTDAQNYFYIYNAQRRPAPFLITVTPRGTASADVFFRLESNSNPGLLVLGSPRPPFRQVAVALGSILKGDVAEDVGGGEVRPTQVPEPRHEAVAARIPAPGPGGAAPPARQTGSIPAPGPTPGWGEPVTAPPGVTLTLVEAPATDARSGSSTKPAPAAAKPASPASSPKTAPQATSAARPATTPRPARAALAPPPRPAPRWTTPAGAPPQTGWIPVDDEPQPAPRWTTPAGAPPQTGWIPVDDGPVAGGQETEPPADPAARPAAEPAAVRMKPPGAPPVIPPKPKPAPAVARSAPRPAAAVPPAPAARPKPKVVFLPNIPGDRVLQIFNPPHISLGQNLVLRQGRAGARGYGWSRIYAEHPNVQVPDIARAATYPHQVWSDGRTFLYLRWSEDQNGAMILQVAGDLIVNAQWATYEELLYWLGPGHVYPRLVYQGAR